MTNSPDISFIMPVHNSSATLERTLKSVFSQSLQNLECIAVNDASTDESPEILNRWEQQEPRLKVIHLKQNAGTLIARKRAAEQSRGKYILSIDPDDEFEHDGAEKLLSLAEKFHADIVHFDLKEYQLMPDKTEKRVWNWCPARHGFLKGPGSAARDLLVTHGHHWSLCLKLIRGDLFRSVLPDIEDFHCIMCEDLYMDLAIELKAESILKSSLSPYIYHTGSTGITTDGKRSLASFRNLLSALKALDLCMKMLPSELQSVFFEVKKNQCRILLTRAQKELDPCDTETAMRELRQSPYCTNAMAAAEKMPLLLSANGENFLLGHPLLRTCIAAILPYGSRRRLFFKTLVKRLLKRN